MYRDLRPALRRFTRRLDELELSFTWAVVGGMVDDPSARDVSHLRGGFARDMQVFLGEAEEFTVDGRDLLDMVTGLKTKQSFATHTYSHLLFSDPEQVSKVIAEDLTRAVAVNTRLGLGASQLVFPRNHSGHLDIVAAAGITHARMPPIGSANPKLRPNRLFRAFESLMRPTSAVEEHSGPEGLVLHHATEFLNWGVSAGKAKRLIQWRRVGRAVDAAAHGMDVHFWLHPFNLAQRSGVDDAVDGFLLRVAELRNRGLINVGGF
ncbi:hypothetical protein OAH95_03950 [Burkholderiaceae bacterium]|nr:hypothetical protein [Burkholderiaceae bacterium]